MDTSVSTSRSLPKLADSPYVPAFTTPKAATSSTIPSSNRPSSSSLDILAEVALSSPLTSLCLSASNKSTRATSPPTSSTVPTKRKLEQEGTGHSPITIGSNAAHAVQRSGITKRPSVTPATPSVGNAGAPLPSSSPTAINRLSTPRRGDRLQTAFSPVAFDRHPGPGSPVTNAAKYLVQWELAPSRVLPLPNHEPKRHPSPLKSPSEGTGASSANRAKAIPAVRDVDLRDDKRGTAASPTRTGQEENTLTSEMVSAPHPVAKSRKSTWTSYQPTERTSTRLACRKSESSKAQNPADTSKRAPLTTTNGTTGTPAIDQSPAHVSQNLPTNLSIPTSTSRESLEPHVGPLKKAQPSKSPVATPLDDTGSEALELPTNHPRKSPMPPSPTKFRLPNAEVYVDLPSPNHHTVHSSQTKIVKPREEPPEMNGTDSSSQAKRRRTLSTKAKEAMTYRYDDADFDFYESLTESPAILPATNGQKSKRKAPTKASQDSSLAPLPESTSTLLPPIELGKVPHSDDEAFRPAARSRTTSIRSMSSSAADFSTASSSGRSSTSTTTKAKSKSKGKGKGKLAFDLSQAGELASDAGPSSSDAPPPGTGGPVIQSWTCQLRMGLPYPRCVHCCKRKAGDTCRFKGVRSFAHGNLQYPSGPATLVDDVGTDVRVLYPSTWNVVPTPGQINRILGVVAKELLPVFECELQHSTREGVIFRRRELDIRNTCDFCMTSIFDSCWICRDCGRELCNECHQQVKSISETSTQEDIQLRIRKVSTRRVKEENQAFRRLMLCHHRNVHRVEAFVPMSRFRQGEMQNIVGEMKTILQEVEHEESKNHTTPPTIPDPLPSSNDHDHPPDPAGLNTLDFPVFNADEISEDIFRSLWARGQALVIKGLLSRFKQAWTPEGFIKAYGSQPCLVVECQSNAVSETTVGEFFSKFGDYNDRTGCLKLKDWPPTSEFSQEFPSLFKDFARAVPIPNYTRRDGVLNVAAHFPVNKGAIAPDIGPKMYNAFEAEEGPGGKGSTRLHMDMADAVNVMMHASPRKDGSTGTAVWDIYRAEDAMKIRSFLKRKFGPFSGDPIHSQEFYLDSVLRREMFETEGVTSWRIYQKPGDAVFIPAGCAHQVCNLADCIKVAVDFVSPENIDRCDGLTREFREENQSTAWKEDVLQLRHMMFHAWNSMMRLKKGEDLDPTSDDGLIPRPATSEAGDITVTQPQNISSQINDAQVDKMDID